MVSAKIDVGADFLTSDTDVTGGEENERFIKASASSGLPRCLVLAHPKQSAEIGPIDRIENANEDFDLILVLAQNDKRATGPEFDLLMASCSNPAAPLVSCSKQLGARADFVLGDTSSASIASALRLVQPLIERVAALPRMVQGVDRHRLLALTLAYTRNLALEARWDPDGTKMVCYPLLLGIPDPGPMLEELASSGLLRRRFFERVFVCGQCDSSRLLVREVCVKCRSSDIEEHPLLHHYSCGFQGAQQLFRQADGYRCPKCAKELRHYGLDYDKPGTTFACHACEDVMSEPDVGFVCTDCGGIQPSDGAARRSWYHYDITADGVAAVRAGILPRWDGEGHGNKRRTVRDFGLLGRQALALATQHDRPIAAFHMTIGTSDLHKSVGPSHMGEVALFAQKLATQCLREGDIAAALQDGIMVCLPEADRSVAEKIVEHVKHTIAGGIKFELPLVFEIRTGKAVGALFEKLR
jgi:hypothetical protein